VKKIKDILLFVWPCAVALVLCSVYSQQTFGATIKTRVTGAVNWNTAATWIQIRTGTAAFTNGIATVTGTGTSFTTELQVGDILILDASPGTVRGTVLSIQSNTQLTLNANAGATASGAYGREQVPGSADDVQIGNTALASAVTVTLDTASASVNSLTFVAQNLSNSLSHSGTNALTVSNDVTINQPTGAQTIAWNINAGTGTVNGNVNIGGTNTSTNRIAKIAITTGTLSVSGNLVYNSSASAGTQVTAVVDMSGGAGTLNLAGSLTLTNGTGTLTPGTTSTVVYNGTGAQTVTFASAITYNDLTINKSSGTATLGAATTIGGDLTLTQGTLSAGASNFNLIVGGNWTNNGGTYSGGSSTVTLTGVTGTIGGTTSTTFPGLSIDAGSAYTMNNDNSCTSLTFVASATATSLTQASGTTLTVNGAVTINQPTASVATAWNINAGTATVSGLITFGGTNTTTARVGKIVITTGTLNANGGITFTASAAATKVIDMSGGAGTLNLKGALTVPAVSSTLTAGTSGSIFNYADTTAQTVNFFSAGAYHNLHLNNTSAGGASLSAAITASNVTGNLRVQSGTFSNGGFAIAGNAAKTIEVVNGATFKVAGTTSAFPTVFGTVTLGATSIVDYSGTGAQTIAAQNYGNLTISAARGANNVTLVSSGTIGVAGTLSDTATHNSGNGFVTTGSTVAYNGTSSQTVTVLSPIVSGSVMYNNLTINNASGVTLGGNVNVGGTLTLTSGNITTSSSSLYISSTGTVSRTSGHVVGNFKKNIATGATSKTFEIGDAGNYTPMTVSFASVTVAGDLTASTTTGDHPNLGSSAINSAKTANRYWTLTNSGITFTNYSVTLNFVAGDVDSGANTSNFIVGRFSSSTWTYPTVGTKTSTSTQATGITAFGDFQVGEGSTTATWTGAVNNLWSNGGNWSGIGGTTPVAGDDLIFPSGAANLSTSNDITAGTSFNSITISGSGYTLAGNSIALGAGDLTDSNSSGSNTINLAISMSATRTLSVNNAGETLTISGVISGAGGLIKNGGNGKLILGGANTYNGTTTINAGTLSISADNNLGTAPGSATPGQLTFSGGTLATTASFTLSANRGVSFGSTGTIDVAASTTLTYGGIAAGSGGLTKTSAGTLILSGVNSYSGTTEVAAGVLNIQNASALGTTGNGTTVDSNASLQLQGGISVGAEPLVLNNAGVTTAGALENVSGTNSWSGAINLASASSIGSTGGTLTLSGNVDNGTFDLTFRGVGNTTVSGIISNGGTLTKSGSGTLTLSGANTFSGTTTISAGILKLGAANVIPDGAGKGDLVMSPASGTATFDLGGFSETVNGLSNSGAGSSLVDNTASSTSPTLTVGGNNASGTFSGTIQNTAGTLSLTKTGTGTLTLSGASTFSGNTTINAGTLSVSADNNLGAAPGSATPGKLNFGGGTLATTATFTLSSNRGIAFNSASTIDVASSTILTYGGIAAGSGSLTKISAGTLILSGANTYSGATTISAGVLSIGADNNLGTAPGSPTAGQLTFGGGTLATTATFSLNANRGIAFSSTGTIDVASSTTLGYGGIATGSGGFTKSNTGTLTLSGVNTYTGTMTISAGTVMVNGSQSSSSVSLNGGTLGGTGTVGAISSTSSGGTASPGSGSGILNSGNVNLSSGSSSFSIELNGLTVGTGYDQLNVTGTVNLTGATLSGGVGFAPTVGTTFIIINNDGSDPVTGTFAGLPEGSAVVLSSQSFTISYVGGTGNDVVLTRIAPNITLANSVNPSGNQAPGTDLTYTVTFTNTQCCAAQSLVITDPVSANTDFKVGSVSTDLGTTGLAVAVEYSNDGGSTWTYSPTSGGGGASAGYDRNVTNIRWTFTGNLSQTSPNNAGSVSFTAKIQ
jgi:fibronectin-binding autotransporter adhesin